MLKYLLLRKESRWPMASNPTIIQGGNPMLHNVNNGYSG